MSDRGLSNHAVVAARPVFTVDGETAAALGEDLQRLEVRADERGFSSLEATFLNWDRPERGGPVDFVHDRAGRLDLGRAIAVAAGGPDDRRRIFSGVVTAIEGRYPQNRPPEITVRADDALFGLGLGQRTRLYDQQSDGDIAAALLSETGLETDARAAGPVHRALWQVNQNDLAFLLERARAVDAALCVEDGRVVFRPRREGTDAPIRLTRHGELLRFTACADLVHQRAAVAVHGYSVTAKEAVHESAGADIATAEREGTGRTGAEIVAEVFPRAVEHLDLEAPFTAEEARALAEARMRARCRSFLRASGTTSGRPAIRVGSRVEVTDVGPLFSGVYVVVVVRHAFDQATGFRTHFEAERADIGRVA